tara:strand:- start:312 stop:641 length:330 start_codon:yes stop_codon:yes gene_type:complete
MPDTIEERMAAVEANLKQVMKSIADFSRKMDEYSERSKITYAKIGVVATIVGMLIASGWLIVEVLVAPLDERLTNHDDGHPQRIELQIEKLRSSQQLVDIRLKQLERRK